MKKSKKNLRLKNIIPIQIQYNLFLPENMVEVKRHHTTLLMNKKDAIQYRDENYLDYLK